MMKEQNTTFFSSLNSIYTTFGLMVGLVISSIVYLILGLIIFIPFYLVGYGEIGSYIAFILTMFLNYLSLRKYMLIKGYNPLSSTLTPAIIFGFVIIFIITAMYMNNNYQPPY